MMHVNLLHAAGVACATIGAFLFLTSLSSTLRARSRIVPMYSRELARRRATQLDLRFGLGLTALGGLMTFLALRGISVPVGVWRYAIWSAAAAGVVYGLLRLAAFRPVHRARSRARPVLYETQRSKTLREAAEREASRLVAREIAAAPCDGAVIYLRSHWERQWWSDKLGVSTAALAAAVRQVGCMKHDVQRHLAAQTA